MLRKGSDFIQALQQSKVRISYRGESFHPFELKKLRLQASVLADYYQAHWDDEANRVEESGQVFSSTLLIPRKPEHLRLKSNSYYSLAKNYLGILGRAPDYINTVFSTWAGCHDLFGEYSENVLNYYEEIKTEDYFITHSTSVLRGGEKTGIRVVKEIDSGVYISGARAMATSAALCDQLFIAPTRVGDREVEKAIVCSIPSTAEGLNIVCRENFSGHSSLASYYDESDALITLDNVFVPWEKVFIYRDLNLYNQIVGMTATSPACSLQTNARAIAKLETLLGLLKAWSKVGPKSETVEVISGDALRDLNILRSLQEDAIRNGSQVGGCIQPHSEKIEAAKLFFMDSYPRLISQLRSSLGAELLYLFEADELTESVVSELCTQWGIQPDVLAARQKISFVLYDILSSSFATRHDLYEKHYAGNHRRVVANYWRAYSPGVDSHHVFNKLGETHQMIDRYFSTKENLAEEGLFAGQPS